MNHERRLPISVCAGLVAALSLSACGGDECNGTASPCGDTKGTYLVCGGAADVPTLNPGRDYYERYCPGLEPLCRTSGSGQHTCEDAVQPEQCGNRVELLDDAPCELVAPSVADFNADRRADLLLTCSTATAQPIGLWWSPQLEDGSFATPTELESAQGSVFSGAFVGDVDGDAVADVVALRSNTLATNPRDVEAFVVFLARDGDLVPSATWPLRELATLQGLADLDGDGALELVLTTQIEVVVLALDGDRVVERERFSLGNLTSTLSGPVAIADFADDGQRSLVLNAYDGSVAFAPRDGTYLPHPELNLPPYATFADFDRDGATDYAGVTRLPRASAIVAISNREGRFSARNLGNWIEGPVFALQVAGNDSLDLIAFHDTNRMSVVLDVAEHGTRQRHTFAIGNGNANLTLGDVDGDGRADIVSGRAGGAQAAAVVGFLGACM